MNDSKDLAVRQLRRNRVNVDTQEKLVKLGKFGPGIKMWRWIDCLCNYCGFHWVREREYG